MVVELNCLMVQGEGFELIIEEEVHSLFIEFQSETLQERDIVVYQLIIVVEVEVMSDQLIQEGMGE